MKIAVIGTGYVGLVSGACLAELGKNVVCVDKNPDKINQLNKGVIPIYEPGLEVLVQQNTRQGRLHFTQDLAEALHEVEAVILAVGTPTDEKTGRADLSYVFAAVNEIADYLPPYAIVITKSTVPVGTGEKVKAILAKKRPSLPNEVASNPEFLREGSAVEDFLHPDRIIIGTESEHGKDVMVRLYKELAGEGHPILFTNIPTAELIKYASNAFLATKIAFTNEMADICEGVGADIEVVVKGMGMDSRIGGKYMHPGPGYGGSCFPKDTLALTAIADDAGFPCQIVQSVIHSNEQRKDRMGEKILDSLPGKAKNKKIAILGLTFKANTDDMRYSPSLPIIKRLLKAKADLYLYDPVGMREAKKLLTKTNVHWCDNVMQAVQDAEAIVIITEWDEFKQFDLNQLKAQMKGNILVDLRNIYDPKKVAQAGLIYSSIGR